MILVLFGFAVVVVIGIAFYTFWEYHLDRLDAFDKLVCATVQEDVHAHYLGPLMLEKATAWCHTHALPEEEEPRSPTIPHNLWPIASPAVRRLFRDIRLATLLQPMEYEALLCISLDAVRGSVPFPTSRATVRELVNDACSDYMMRPGPMQHVWQSMSRLYKE